jgi:hypothetical protein
MPGKRPEPTEQSPPTRNAYGDILASNPPEGYKRVTDISVLHNIPCDVIRKAIRDGKLTTESDDRTGLYVCVNAAYYRWKKKAYRSELSALEEQIRTLKKNNVKLSKDIWRLKREKEQLQLWIAYYRDRFRNVAIRLKRAINSVKRTARIMGVTEATVYKYWRDLHSVTAPLNRPGRYSR